MPANIMLPTKAKMTAFVCSGRRRPKVSHDGVEIRLPARELRGDEDADEHADDAPEDGGEHELADGRVVVFDAGFGSGRRACGNGAHGSVFGEDGRVGFQGEQRVAFAELAGIAGRGDPQDHEETDEQKPDENGQRENVHESTPATG